MKKAGTNLHVSLILSIAMEKLHTNELYAFKTIDFENYNEEVTNIFQFECDILFGLVRPTKYLIQSRTILNEKYPLIMKIFLKLLLSIF